MRIRERTIQAMTDARREAMFTVRRARLQFDDASVRGPWSREAVRELIEAAEHLAQPPAPDPRDEQIRALRAEVKDAYRRGWDDGHAYED